MTNPQRTDNPIPKAPREPLPGGPINGAPEPLQNAVWQWTASNAEDDEAARDDTIIDWHEPDDGQHGWYIVTRNADGDPLVRTGPYADDPFVVERALEQTFPPPYGTEPDMLESYAEEIARMLDSALQLRVHEAAARFAQEYDVDDDGNSKNLERLQRACDVRHIWMDG